MASLPEHFLSHCANEVAESMHLKPRHVSKWTAEYLITGTIVAVPRLSTHRQRKIRIENGRALGMEHIFECLEVISKRKILGFTTNSGFLHNHLLSSNRETCSIDLLPPCDVSCAAILDAMKTYGGVRWGKMKRSGRSAEGATDEGAQKRLFRIRVWLVEYYKAKLRSNSGESIIVSMDESYVHKGHMQEFGLLFTDQDGRVLERFETVGKGSRICMAGCISKYGHIVTTRNGQYVKDCAWLNSKLLLPEGNQPSRFVELNNVGEARDIYVQKMSGVTLVEFVRIAQSFKIETVRR